MSEVEIYDWDEDGMLSEFSGYKDIEGHWVKASDYDALATQRDEGLAREEWLKGRLADSDNAARSLSKDFDALQQRLAEAEKLLREANEGFKDFMSDALIRRIDAFLSIPGCADGEKAEHPTPDKYGDVLAPFLRLMTRELHANAAKGDRPGWLQMTPEQCLLEIYYHVSKLQKAVRDNDPVRVAENTADVANMAMMMADIFGILESKQ